MKETIYKRIFVIVLDSLGIGAMPDSEKFGDRDVDTFGHILDRMGTLEIPNLQKLGMLNLHTGGKMYGIENPVGKITRLKEASNGKDTMTGHWEMMGIRTDKPFKTFTETGFPQELIAELEKRCGKRVIGNKSASGTEIIEELGEEEINTGAMIVYTSADSVKKFYQIKKYIIKIIYAVKDFNYYHAGSIIGSFPISAYPPSYYILSEEEKKIFQQDVERQKEELLEYIKNL